MDSKKTKCLPLISTAFMTNCLHTLQKNGGGLCRYYFAFLIEDLTARWQLADVALWGWPTCQHIAPLHLCPLDS
jgi:hypothetical protein